MGLGIYVLLAAALLDITTPDRLRALDIKRPRKAPRQTPCLCHHTYM